MRAQAGKGPGYVEFAASPQSPAQPPRPWRPTTTSPSGPMGPEGLASARMLERPAFVPRPLFTRGAWNDGNLWRCGESNPGPTVVQQDFSGCSSCLVFSAPASPTNKNADGLSHLGVPQSPMTRDSGSGSLDDARNRGGSAPRADGLRSSLRRRGRSRCECYRHLLVRTER